METCIDDQIMADPGHGQKDQPKKKQAIGLSTMFFDFDKMPVFVFIKLVRQCSCHLFV